MSEFNLIDESWIPVRFLNGTCGELGIKDTLLRAQEIAAIEYTSPLVVASLHRFLLAVLYRALQGPTDIDQAKAFFKSGLPAKPISDYLEKWRPRFWLFDDKYPFYQIPSFVPKEWRAWSVLAAEHNADNAKVLFDHLDVTSPGNIPPSFCARWLLAVQTFPLSQKSELSYCKNAPSATAAMIFPQGNNLMDTLLFGLVPENKVVLEGDCPVWEAEPEKIEMLKKGPVCKISGFCNLYTWRARTILLKCHNSMVESVAFASGLSSDDDSFNDPFVGYIMDEKKGRLPVRFRERGLWRSFDSLLPAREDKKTIPPAVIENAVALGRSFPNRFPVSVLLLGQASDKAKIEFWRMEQFALPAALVGDRYVRAEIHQILEDAEKTYNALWGACDLFARNCLAKGERKTDKTDISDFVKQTPAISQYWSVLESRFHEILADYSVEREPDDIRLKWLECVRDALKTAWKQFAASVESGDAWAIRALVKAEGPVMEKIKELNREIAKYTKTEVAG